jgi:hypothetical protein
VVVAIDGVVEPGHRAAEVAGKPPVAVRSTGLGVQRDAERQGDHFKNCPWLCQCRLARFGDKAGSQMVRVMVPEFLDRRLRLAIAEPRFDGPGPGTGRGKCREQPLVEVDVLLRPLPINTSVVVIRDDGGFVPGVDRLSL